MRELKPEMHDIGKLIDKSRIEKHNFEDYPGKLRDVPDIIMNRAWEGILQHHCSKQFDQYPKSFQAFILSLADDIAAATSRHGMKKDKKEEFSKPISGKPRYNVHKLWNPSPEVFHELSKVIGVDSADPKWISKIVRFVNKNPTTEEFFKIFEDYLKKRAEDAHPGSNITSLWTHSKLTGLIYNFLYGYFESIGDKEFKAVTKDEVRNYIDKKKRDTKIKVAKLRLRFSQSPARVKDLNIFDALAEVRKKILKEYPNNVIFSSSDELLLLLPLSENFEKIKEIISEYGFWAEVVVRVQDLNQPHPDPDRQLRLIEKKRKVLRKKFKKEIEKVPRDKRKTAEESIRKTIDKSAEARKIEELKKEYLSELDKGDYKKISIYPDLPLSIGPPICELCQMKKATKKWVDEESGITEELCIHCFNIRERGSKFPKLEKWGEDGADRILWVKVDLNLNQLISVLEELYIEYLKELGVRKDLEERAEIRFSVLSEFDWDYKNFLNEFKKKTLEIFGEDNFQQILDEFICIKANNLKEILLVLRIFDKVFSERFPKFKEMASPVRVGIVCSNIKYPFLECWRILSDLKNEVSVSLIGKGEIKLNMSQLTSFLEMDVKDKGLLYKLTTLSEKSRILAKIALYDQSDRRDYKRYSPLRDAVKKFGFQNVLTYTKIMSG